MRKKDHMNLRCLFVGLSVTICISGGPVHAGSQPTPARPDGNPGGWINTADYPPEALMAHSEGVTAYKLSIDTKGVITNCVVTASSGSAVLDDATCRVLKQRGSFIAATDSKGRPIGSSYYGRTRWAIPAPPRPTLPKGQQTARIANDFDASGQLENCRVLEWHAPGDGRAFCQHMPRPSYPTIFLGEDGKPTAYTTIMTQTIEFEARPAASPQQPLPPAAPKIPGVQ